MTQVEIDAAALLQQCQIAVERVVARYQCALLDPTELTRRTYEHMQQAGAASPVQAAVGMYSLALYQACSGNEGLLRQELGYQELYRYLYNLAVRRYPDVCEDATQAALLQVYTRFSACRQPIAFLMFALRELMNATRVVRRQSGIYARSLEAITSNTDESLAAFLADPLQPDPMLVAIDHEAMAQLYQLIAEFHQAHPRAVKQLAALIMKYLRGMSDEEISEALQVAVKSVHELRSRARHKLRNDPQWRILANAAGLLVE